MPKVLQTRLAVTVLTLTDVSQRLRYENDWMKLLLERRAEVHWWLQTLRSSWALSLQLRNQIQPSSVSESPDA